MSFRASRSLRAWLALVVASAALAIVAPAIAADGAVPTTAIDDSTPAPGERELFARLIAPCCWNQTLDVHEGAAPDKLRSEIRARLKAGESAASIEADMVARYGEKVRTSTQSSTLGAASLAVIAAALGVGVLLVLAMRKWLRASRTAVAKLQPATRQQGDDLLDARIDAELRAMD